MHSFYNGECKSVIYNKMKKTKYHILRTIQKSNIKIVEKDKIDHPNTPRLFVKHLSEFQF